MTSKQTNQAEFDNHAHSYGRTVNNKIKRLLGGSNNGFIRAKAEWLVGEIGSEFRQTPPRVLDYGCGTGLLIGMLRDLVNDVPIVGCDVSSAMVDVARQSEWASNKDIELDVINPSVMLPYDTHSFDVTIASGVFHHIAVDERDRCMGELYRVTKQGGRLFIFEHNPFNPATRFMVSRSPLDQNAVLLSAHETVSAMQRAGFNACMTQGLLYLPPLYNWLRRLDRTLGRLPFGGQYVAVGQNV